MTIPFNHHGENSDLVVQPFAGVFAGPIPEAVLQVRPVQIPKEFYDNQIAQVWRHEYDGNLTAAKVILEELGLRPDSLEGDGK